MPEPSILDERLAEIDRRLRTIQTDLAPAPTRRAAQSPSSPERACRRRPRFGSPRSPSRSLTRSRHPPAPSLSPTDTSVVDALLGQLRELGEAHERLLELHRELLGQYGRGARARARPPRP